MHSVIHKNKAQHAAIVITSGFRMTPEQWECMRMQLRHMASEAGIGRDANIRFDLVLSVTEDDQR